MSRVWIILFSIFIIYSGYIFLNCDKKNNNITSPSPKVLAGWNTWQNKNCQACHQLYGLGGYLGPDLTNIASDSVKKEAYIRTFIKYGTGRMPNFHLDDSEVTNVIAFLQWVDKSGNTRVAADQVTIFGNYKFEN